MSAPLPDGLLATHEVLSKVISRLKPGTHLQARLYDVDKHCELPGRAYEIEQQKFEERTVLHFKDESFRLTKDHFLLIDYAPVDAELDDTELPSHPSRPQPPAQDVTVSHADLSKMFQDKFGAPLASLADMIDKRLTAVERSVGIEDADGAGADSPNNFADQRNSTSANTTARPDPLGGIASAPKKFVVSVTLPAEVQLMVGLPQVLVDPYSTYAPKPRITTVPGSSVAVLNTSRLDDKRWELLANFYVPTHPGRYWTLFSPPHLLAGSRAEVDARLNKLEEDLRLAIEEILDMHRPKPPKPPPDNQQKSKKDHPPWVMPDNAWAVQLYKEASRAYVATLKRIASGVYPQTPSDWEAEVLWLVANLLMSVADRNRSHVVGGALIYNKYRAAMDSSEPVFDPASWFKECFA
jgi:hypothetical protein